LLRPSLGRLWRTVRPLKRDQIFGRLAHEARQRAFRRVPALLPLVLGVPDAPAVALTGRSPRAESRGHPEPVNDADQLARAETAVRHGRGRLAGHDVALRDWGRADLPRLVRYHLHYLDTARDLAEAARFAHRPAFLDPALALVRDWSAAHPLRGSEAWEPYPTSCRLQNLCVLAFTLGAQCPDWLRRLLVAHARFVLAFPETHLHGNHLLKNWTALALAGFCLEGEEAASWEQHGIEGVHHEWGEQVLPDGGHAERSPMYHLLAFSDFLDLRDFGRARGSKVLWLDAALASMARLTATILHPDGEIPLFNDSALGHAPHPAKLFARLGQVPEVDAGQRVQDTPHFGLTALRPSRDEAVLFDTGPLGLVHQPGHAHSDTLSYELSVDGERRVVNAGLDGYQTPNRAFFRSAVAHNTVTVDGEGPDELWSTFRVGGRCRVLARAAEDRRDYVWARGNLVAFQGWHQRRTLALFPGQALVIVDRVDAARPVTAVSRARMAPGHAALRFVALEGAPAERRTAYAPELGKVFDIAEHSVQAEGASVSLAYALVWGDVQLSWDSDASTVTLNGRSYRLD
jgi:uncharacterized heparinase superfamily protein